MEEKSILDYNRQANEVAAKADSVSKKLFEDLGADEEWHFDQYDMEMGNLENYGEQYLALQSIERSKNISGGAPTG